MFLFGVCGDTGFSILVTSTACLYVCEEVHICTSLHVEVFMRVCYRPEVSLGYHSSGAVHLVF